MLYCSLIKDLLSLCIRPGDTRSYCSRAFCKLLDPLLSSVSLFLASSTSERWGYWTPRILGLSPFFDMKAPANCLLKV